MSSNSLVFFPMFSNLMLIPSVISFISVIVILIFRNLIRGFFISSIPPFVFLNLWNTIVTRAREKKKPGWGKCQWDWIGEGDGGFRWGNKIHNSFMLTNTDSGVVEKTGKALRSLYEGWRTLGHLLFLSILIIFMSQLEHMLHKMHLTFCSLLGLLVPKTLLARSIFAEWMILILRMSSKNFPKLGTHLLGSNYN